jgi:hypothetical protein
MGRSYSRPVSASLVAGANTVNIPLNRHASRTHIQVILTGANTFSIDSTLDSIHFSTAVLASAVNLQPNNPSRQDPSNANWSEELPSAAVAADVHLNAPVAAIRIVKSAGAGTAEVRIQQA